MDKFFERIGWKKLSLLLGFFGILFLAFVIFSFIQLFQSENNGLSRNPSEDFTKNPIPTSNISQPNTQKFVTDDYSIEYPSNWNRQAINLKGGEGVTISPVLNAAVFNPRIVIEATSSRADSLEKKKSGFSAFGFSESKDVLGTLAATKMRGVIIINGDSRGKARYVQETYYVFEYAGNTFLVGYEYESEKINQEQEDQLSSIIASFTLSK